MRSFICCLLFLSIGWPTLFAQSGNTPVKAITHATIINLVNGKLETDQTILIDSNRIVAVGPFKKINIQPGAEVIDATGKFVIPGMVDAHIHFFQSGGLYTRPDGLNLGAIYSYEKDQQWIKDNLADQMARYLACGITTVVDVGGPFGNYAVRDKVNSDPASPNAWVTGPLISTYLPNNLDKKDPPIIKVTTPEEARALVQRQLPYKPDFIKIWYIVLPNQPAQSTLPIIKAAIEESHANGLKVAVHATEYQTAKLAVENGADILVHSVDDSLIDEKLLQLLRNKKIVYIPTLIVAQNYNRTFTQQFNFSQHDLTYANPFMLGTLMDLQHIDKKKVPFDYTKMKGRFPVPGKEDTIMAANLKRMQEQGGLVVAGTDAGNVGTHHAASFYAELLTMKNAGLTNLQILQAATINAARGFGKEKDYGSIEKGKIADLLVLDKDPTQDLSSLAHINLVIHRGRSFQPSKLLPQDPATLVQQQLNAYNARDIEAFLAPYSDSVELYEFPSKMFAKGKENMRRSYATMFEQVKELHCQVTERIIQGNVVIDHESVTGFRSTPVRAIAIYTIEGGKIAKVHFIQ